MTYLEDQRSYQVGLLKGVLGDPGGGIYKGASRDFVLQDRSLNLFQDVRAAAIKYFQDHDISWWDGGPKNQLSGHLLSSQISCVNHLFTLRTSKSSADVVIRNIDPLFEEVKKLSDEGGYLAFEKSGAINLGREKTRKRGAYSTSIDALVLVRRSDGGNTLVLIEWKYTESYRSENKRWYIRKDAKRGVVRKTDKLENYRALLDNDACPLKWQRYDDYFYEPYYQLMRQTLLGWQMTVRGDFGYAADDWLHLHVIPEANVELRERVTSPGLMQAGDNLESTWRTCLKDPSRYRILSPPDLLEPLQNDSRAVEWLSYLEKRYWSGLKTI